MEQVDCEMHLVSLALLHALGLRGNVKTIEKISGTGNYTKVKAIVTPGGSFVEGVDVFRQLRQLAKYFGPSQRKQQLAIIQEKYAIPKGIPQIDGITRVASCHKFLQTSMLHYYAMDRLYRDSKGKDEDFTELWTTMPKEFSTLVKEMERLTSILVSYALGEAQLDLVTASATFYFRRICEKYSSMDKYQVIYLSTRSHL
jgi:hypothetical protein